MASTSFVFIDEFDAFYHFKLSYEVCKTLFALPCQAFTSSHNTYLMTNELLRPDYNFILQDNKIKPLSECTDKELRLGHNIEKMFFFHNCQWKSLHKASFPSYHKHNKWTPQTL